MEFITTLARPLISFLKETNNWLNDLYNTWYLISKSNFQKGHPVPKNIKLTIDPVGIRLFYANFDQGYKDIDQIIAPREEINLYIKNSNNPYNRNYFSERIRNFTKYFQVKKKFYNIALNKILWIICENKKKKKKKLFKETKNKLLEESKILSQTCILYDISNVLKQTFLSELEKFTNIYSQFTILCKKNDQNFKSFTIDDKTKLFQLKNDSNGEKNLSLLLRKLNGSPAKLLSNKISIIFLVK